MHCNLSILKCFEALAEVFYVTVACIVQQCMLVNCIKTMEIPDVKRFATEIATKMRRKLNITDSKCNGLIFIYDSEKSFNMIIYVQ